MNLIFKIKHWQLFFLMLVFILFTISLPYLYLKLSVDFEAFYFSKFISISILAPYIFYSVIYIIYSLGFNKYLDKTHKKINILLLVLSSLNFISLMSFLFLVLFTDITRYSNVFSDFIFPLLLFINIFLCPLILSKNMEHLSNPFDETNWSQIIQMYFAFLLLPIGLWFIQPILNEFNSSKDLGIDEFLN